MNATLKKLRGMYQSPVFPVLAAFAIGLACAAIVLFFLQTRADARGHTELTLAIRKLQAHLSLETSRNRVMGAAALMGLNDPVLKQAAQGKFKQDDPEVLKRLHIVRQQFSAEGTYVVDATGVMVANDTDGKRSTGRSIAFRPYFKRAINGLETMYAAIGTNSDARGLYFAAPLYAGTTDASPIIGIVSIKMPGEPLDAVLKKIQGSSMLISPQGVVFASSRPEWLLNMTPPFSAERVAEIRTLKQFGKRFEHDSPAVLDFNPMQSTLDIKGVRYLVEHAELEWDDPAGKWQVVLMHDANFWFPYAQKLLIVVGMLMVSVIAGLWITSQLMKHRKLTMQLAHEQAERNRSRRDALRAAEERSNIANIALALRNADDIPELVSVFMNNVADWLHVRYGLMYLADEDRQKITILGGFGVPVEHIGTEFDFGDGLAGQCAIEEKPMLLDKLPANYVKITSGTGEASPTCIVVRPLIFNERLIGVVELATLHPLTSKDQTMLEEIEPVLAGSLQILGHQQELEKGFAFQQTLIDTIPYPIFYKGPDTRFLGFNRAYEQTFKVRRKNLIGKRVLDLEYLPRADRIAYQAEDERVIAETGAVQREMLIPFKDGILHKTLYFVSGFRRADGSPGGLVGTFIDISDLNNKE